MCIAWKISVHAAVGEVTANTIGVEVEDEVSFLIISLSATVLLSGSFGFRRCGISLSS